MSGHAINIDMVLSRDNVHLRPEAARTPWMVAAALGLVLTGLAFFTALTGDAKTAEVALHAYHIGFIACLGLSLGSMGFVMILHQVNAGWSATIRRQLENMMSLIWVSLVLFVIGAVLQVVLMGKGVYLFDWMNPEYVAGDHVYEAKKAFLNVPFFMARSVLYFVIWGVLTVLLWSLSTRQDNDGDKWHTTRARTLSSVGLLLFAFTTAFAGFDWLMSLDYHWFSTMWGVYFFAGNMASTIAAACLIMIALRKSGRLHTAFTAEHMHDLGKLLFAFCVFWAYIGFSQYFLIWYAGIPEETSWFIIRKDEKLPWHLFSWLLPIGHFIVPFVLLMARPARRSMTVVALLSVWVILMHVADLIFTVRPEVGKGDVSLTWIDAVGVAGPMLLFLGLLIRQIASGPLVPLKDPRLPEALSHKNYV